MQLRKQYHCTYSMSIGLPASGKDEFLGLAQTLLHQLLDHLLYDQRPHEGEVIACNTGRRPTCQGLGQEETRADRRIIIYFYFFQL